MPDLATSVSGHRGFGAGVVDGHRENTPGSVLAAVEAGAGWVEIDARRTADGRLVSYHNPELADGRLICELSLVEVVAAGVATVGDLLEAAPDDVGVNVDVKTSTVDARLPWSETTGGMLEPLVAARAARGPVLVSSFDPSVPVAVRDRVPDVDAGLLGWLWFPLRKLVPAAVHLGLDAVVFHDGSAVANDADGSDYVQLAGIGAELAATADLGLTTVCYCPTPEHARRLWDAGLDVACVNDVPGAVAEARQAQHPAR